MASSTRKLTSLSCNLKQPSFKKEVQLQAFAGVQPKDCAGRNPMSRDTVMDICKDLVRHAPELEEPRCDFCQKAGQNEGIYLCMELRYGKKKPVIPQPAVSVAAQPADRSVTLQPKKKRASHKKTPSSSKSETAAEEAVSTPALQHRRCLPRRRRLQQSSDVSSAWSHASTTRAPGVKQSVACSSI